MKSISVNLWWVKIKKLLLLLILCTMCVDVQAATEYIYHDFEDGLNGWEFSTEPKELGIRNLSVSSDWSYSGTYSLKLDVNIISNSNSDNNIGFAYIMLPGKMGNRVITAKAYCMPGSGCRGASYSPNGIQLFIKDQNWGYQDSYWLNMQENVVMPLSLTVSQSHDDVIVVGVKVGAGATGYTGPIYIDFFNISREMSEVPDSDNVFDFDNLTPEMQDQKPFIHGPYWDIDHAWGADAWNSSNITVENDMLVIDAAFNISNTSNSSQKGYVGIELKPNLDLNNKDNRILRAEIKTEPYIGPEKMMASLWAYDKRDAGQEFKWYKRKNLNVGGNVWNVLEFDLDALPQRDIDPKYLQNSIGSENLKSILKVGIQFFSNVNWSGKIYIDNITIGGKEILSNYNPLVQGFVTTNGAHFELNGEPFYFAGGNNYYPFYKSHYMIDDLMDALQYNNLTVFRVWGFSDGMALCAQDNDSIANGNEGCTFQPELGVYHEPTFVNFDYVIKSAAEHDIRLIIPLVNYWSDRDIEDQCRHAFGGMAQYLEWRNITLQYVDGELANKHVFYTNNDIKHDFKNYISHMLSRNNTLTGIPYKEDPTIMAWELANEPECSSALDCNQGRVIKEWAIEMSSFIKSIDSNHMVSIGDQGYFNYAGSDWNYSNYSGYSGSGYSGYSKHSGIDWAANLAIPNIDFGTVRVYPHHWGKDLDWANKWIKDHIEIAETFCKPVVFEEFGVETWYGDRDTIYTNWTNLFYNYSGYGADGDLVWMIAGRVNGPGDEHFNDTDGYFYPDSDGYTFWNNTANRSTMNIIKNHANMMKNKRVTRKCTAPAKNGSDFDNISGNYLTATHCIENETCGWIQNNEIILGGYDSNQTTWTGATARWDFDVPQPVISSIKRAVLNVSWSSGDKSGLHSSREWIENKQGEARISVGNINNTIDRLKCELRYQKNADSNFEYYAYNPDKNYLLIPIPSDLIANEIVIYFSVANYTLWGIKELSLKLYTDNGVDIVDGKIYVENREWIVKGISYAPWLLETGPDPYLQDSLPGEYENVTELVRCENKNIYVMDYNGDGEIQMWEVIQYDLDMIHNLGVNTIRTYGTGVWHDKNLDGKVNTSIVPEKTEIIQGDIPEWLYDRMFHYCLQNNMKIIIGYWVQEENFQDENLSKDDYQLECDLEDLAVTNDTLTRVVEKYTNHPAVLAWGIGNEVNGEWNHKWFNWMVNINDYLNQLFAAVKEADSLDHPIMYAKYVQENTNFNNLAADIIAINAYTYPPDHTTLLNEFSIPEPSGKAYMFGEYAHNIEDAKGHWNLSKQHAGGCFLEYNDVWWKTNETTSGSPENELGLVEECRKIRYDRYNVLYRLYVQGCNETICPPPAELTITNTSYLPQNPLIGDNVTIIVRIQNLENILAEDLDNVNVSLHIDNLYDSKIINLMNKNHEEVNFSWIAVEGTHNITVTVDLNNEVNESNESNNKLIKFICVSRVIPHNKLYINEDTVFCEGFYNNASIIINSPNVVMDCNGAVLNGTGNGYGIYNPGFDNVTIKNCNVMNYDKGIFLSPNIANHYIPSGWMGTTTTIKEFNDSYDINCHSENTCIKVKYVPSYNTWAGIYWQYPENNWGNSSGYNLTGAVNLTFWAKGENGGEKIEFKMGGINRPPYNDPNKPFQDSCGPVSTGVITLNNIWHKYTIDLTGEDLSNIIGGFVWVSNYNNCYGGCTFYLDDIKYVYKNKNFSVYINKQNGCANVYSFNYNNVFNNYIVNNNYGILIEDLNSSVINSNIVCGNFVSDFNLVDSYGNSGNNNKCNTGNWNDNGVNGCWYACSGLPRICDINNDGIIFHDYKDLMTAYKCFLGIRKSCDKIKYQDWNPIEQEYECFIKNDI